MGSETGRNAGAGKLGRAQRGCTKYDSPSLNGVLSCLVAPLPLVSNSSRATLRGKIAE